MKTASILNFNCRRNHSHNPDLIVWRLRFFKQIQFLLTTNHSNLRQSVSRIKLVRPYINSRSMWLDRNASQKCIGTIQSLDILIFPNLDFWNSIVHNLCEPCVEVSRFVYALMKLLSVSHIKGGLVAKKSQITSNIGLSRC